jgi:hypothetical protein
MTTQRQIAANRRSAQRSTGPRTAAGKAASSGNARRHGLTVEPDEDAVLSWFRVLLEDETAVPSVYEQHPFRRAALELARAEAHLQRVRAAEEQSLRELEGPSDREKDLVRERDHTAEALLDDVFVNLTGTDVFRLVPSDEQWLLPRTRPQPPKDRAELKASIAESPKKLGVSIELPPVDQAELEAAYDADFEAFFGRLEAFVRGPLVEVGWDKVGFGNMRRLDKEIERIRSERRDAHERVAPTLSRYRALAEARRERALARWTAQLVLRSQPEGSA